jgi:hypothetical protein
MKKNKMMMFIWRLVCNIFSFFRPSLRKMVIVFKVIIISHCLDITLTLWLCFSILKFFLVKLHWSVGTMQFLGTYYAAARFPAYFRNSRFAVHCDLLLRKGLDPYNHTLIHKYLEEIYKSSWKYQYFALILAGALGEAFIDLGLYFELLDYMNSFFSNQIVTTPPDLPAPNLPPEQSSLQTPDHSSNPEQPGSKEELRKFSVGSGLVIVGVVLIFAGFYVFKPSW